jgi:hypothetical protein
VQTLLRTPLFDRYKEFTGVERLRVWTRSGLIQRLDARLTR